MIGVMRPQTAAQRVVDSMPAVPPANRGIVESALGAALLREGLWGGPIEFRHVRRGPGGLAGVVLYAGFGAIWLVVTTPFGHPEAALIGVLILSICAVVAVYTISVAMFGAKMLATGRKRLVGEQVPADRDQIARNAIAEMVAMRWPDGSALVARPLTGGVEVMRSVPDVLVSPLTQTFGDRLAPLVSDPISGAAPDAGDPEPDGTHWAEFPDALTPQVSPPADSSELPPPPVPRRGIVEEPDDADGTSGSSWQNYR
jgi:hypothetical protein